MSRCSRHGSELANNSELARKALDDLEKAHAQALRERKAAEEQASRDAQRLRELGAKLDHGDRQSTDLEAERQRLSDELKEERDRHTADLAERDFAMSQTQITYQSEYRITVKIVCSNAGALSSSAKLTELIGGAQLSVKLLHISIS